MPCDQAVAERPRYYARQIITPDDMTLEQEYFRSRLRQHNRLLHGWGVVCGLDVCLVPKANGNGAAATPAPQGGEPPQPKAEPWKVVVKPGYALSPCGDEINVDCHRIFDLRTRSVTGITGETCLDVPDPWCSEVFEQRDANPLYVAVRYKEVPARPVRVQPTGCGCDDTRCEYSRLRDGYEIGVLTSRPDSCDAMPVVEVDFMNRPLPTCPTRPDDLWVVLAEVELGDNGDITKITNCGCRRMVFSAAELWWKCKEKEMAAQTPAPGLPADNPPRVEPVPAKGGATPSPPPPPPPATSTPTGAASSTPAPPAAPTESVPTAAPAMAAPAPPKPTSATKRKRRKGTDEEI
jgi:hypothetical protein